MSETENKINYEDLEKEFLMNYEFDTTSHVLSENPKRKYKPNPVISDKPEFCLIALEPSLPELGDTRERVNYIDLLFMQSYNNLILQYCAFTYLCNNKFNYQITDICKTPLTQKEHNVRNFIFPKWIELLKHELEYFNNPIIIAVGTKTKNALDMIDYSKEIYEIPHYSGNNTKSSIFNNISNEIGENYQDKALKIIEEVREFTINKLIPHLQFTDSVFAGNKFEVDIESLNKLFDLEKIKTLKRPLIRYLAYEKIFNEINQKYSK